MIDNKNKKLNILVADCYDSFVYNLVELLRPICDYTIMKIDECTSIELQNFDGILLSPGPGVPSKVEGLYALIERSYKTHPILGICLGHQAIATFWGANLEQMVKPLHGHADYIKCADGVECPDDYECPDGVAIKEENIFETFNISSPVGRYHSWVVSDESFPSELKVIARSVYDDKIMAIRHRNLPIWGVQFHPESYLSIEGKEIIQKWLTMVCKIGKTKYSKI